MASDRPRPSPSARLTAWIRRRRNRRFRPAPGLLYAGHRDERAAVYVVTRNGLAALRPLGSRGPAYDWGADTPGALALAYALLADLTRARVPAGVAAALAAGPIAELPRDGFVLDARDLERWLTRVRPSVPSAWAPQWPGRPLL